MINIFWAVRQSVWGMVRLGSTVYESMVPQYRSTEAASASGSLIDKHSAPQKKVVWTAPSKVVKLYTASYHLLWPRPLREQDEKVMSIL